MKFSAIILTKNEEKNIERCLRSVEFCDERIVIDDNSTDNTVAIAEQYATDVVKRSLNGDFTDQRNYGMTIAKGEWILYIDADEEVSFQLQDEIVDLYEKNKLTKRAYFIPRIDYFYNKEIKHGEVADARKNGFIRLVKKNSGKWTGKVHERFAIKAVVGRLKNYIIHYPHPTIKNFLSEINNYSTIRAKELYAKGTKTNVIEIVAYPFFKFIYSYFLRRGFQDGPEGFIYSFMMSFHSFLVRAKLYQYTKIDTHRS